MTDSMAGQAQPEENSEKTGKSIKVPRADRDACQEAAAKLYGQGFERAKIARMMVDHLVPNGKHRPLEQRLSQARTRLRSWENSQAFRDKVYNLAVVKLDLQTPAILGGVAAKAKRGRVDAARLALEITGRHNPKGDSAPAQVAIVFSGVPRPGIQADIKQVEIVDGQAIVEEDDEV